MRETVAGGFQDLGKRAELFRIDLSRHARRVIRQPGPFKNGPFHIAHVVWLPRLRRSADFNTRSKARQAALRRSAQKCRMVT
jgi:hypothetical protein